MPTTISTQSLPDNTYKITVAFTDSAGSAVTPNDGCTWTLTDTSGTTINSRSAVAITEATSVDIVLYDADLAAQGAEDDGIRLFAIDGTYDSDEGNNLTLDKTFQFVIADVQLPVTLQDAKAHMRITANDDDIYISYLIKAARQWVEEYTGRKLITQTVTRYLDDWPDENYIDLPYGGLQSVTSIKYTDSDGDQSTWSSGDYIVETGSNEARSRGRVVLAYDETYPTDVLYPSNPIEIIYVCGYGATKGHVPATIRQAIMILVSEWYENREPYHNIPFMGAIPHGVENILMPHCIRKL